MGPVSEAGPADQELGHEAGIPKEGFESFRSETMQLARVSLGDRANTGKDRRPLLVCRERCLGRYLPVAPIARAEACGSDRALQDL